LQNNIFDLRHRTTLARNRRDVLHNVFTRLGFPGTGLATEKNHGIRNNNNKKKENIYIFKREEFCSLLVILTLD
jgi:hypothetical protein